MKTDQVTRGQGNKVTKAGRRIFSLSPGLLVSLSLLSLCAAGPATKPAASRSATTKPASAAGGAVVTIKKIDDTTASGTLVGLEKGQIVLRNPDARVALEDLVELTQGAAPAADKNPGGGHKLTGKVIGTNGSYQGQGNTKDKAFDGNLDTFFDAPQNNATAWVGIDLGDAKVITQIKYAPRAEFPERMVGGRFQGSNSPTFRGDQTELFSVAAEPAKGKLTSQEIRNTKAFRYVRYVGPDGGSCNVAEIEVWGKDAGSQPTPPPSTPAPSTPAPAPKAAIAKEQPASKPTSGGGETVRALFGEEDRFTAPVVSWTEKGLRLATASAGEVDVPVEALREVWRHATTQEQVAQAKALPLDPGPEDAAFVVKDNGVVVVRGIVMGVEGDALRFKFGDDVRRIKLEKLVGVVFGGQDAKRDRSFKQTFSLSNGDTVSGKWTGFDPSAKTLALTTPWGANVSVPLSSVSRIRSANGRLVYVSDLKPAAVEQTPYFDRMLAYRVDKSLTGGPLKMVDGDVTRGIAVHSRTVLTYDVGGEYQEFKAKVGFQQPEGRVGQAAIRVLGDGKVLYEDLDARGDAPKPAEVSVSIAGVRQLTLEVDYGKGQDTGDRVIWGNARLLRAVKQ